MLKVFPNPYHHIDHFGRLAGACPEGEEVRPGEQMPAGRHVGAVRDVVDYKPGIPSPVAGAAPIQYSKTNLRFIFDAHPVDVVNTGGLESYYTARIRDRELFEIVGDGLVRVTDEKGKPKDVPLLEALVAARVEAILAFPWGVGKFAPAEVPEKEWAEQFPADTEVSKAGAAALNKAKQAIKARAEKPAEPAKVEPEKPYSLTPPKKTPEPGPTGTQPVEKKEP